MFTKILIANRGEIACRVIRTARRMGIATVAVYSEADANALHVRSADEAVLIGPAAARESYLVAERILEAARTTGAQAIHPGYGFLSERAEFAEACEKAGIVFIGPPASAIHAMGSKSAAKALMEKAGVPLTPGYHGENQSPAFLAEQAKLIGFPLLIKASAGGGGKGMRRVDRAEDFAAALESCKREAASSFKDDRVLLEEYVVRPRHIEIQVFGDSHGDVIYLFERDCSVQRRHQKVLEEAPAPGMTPERRAAMGKAAVDAAKAVGYVGAGTVEFIARQDGGFYFMEMNTRLQVEHPVTEMITGQDLVEWQLRVAAGARLPLRQDQLSIRGHAIEARIYAEDPDAGFLPSTGRLTHLRPPAQSANVRVDTGVEQGDAITPYYDPMIAKLIVWDADRTLALAQMRRALEQYQIVGVANNVEFLGRLVATASFAQADLDTGLIEREQEALFPKDASPSDDVWLVAAAAEIARLGAQAKQASPWDRVDYWRLNANGRGSLYFNHRSTRQEIRIEVSDGGFTLALNGAAIPVSITLAGDDVHVRLADRSVHATIAANGAHRHLFLHGRKWSLTRVDPLQPESASDDHHGGLTAPMPGKIIALVAKPGSTIEKGAPILVMEAMKMEHTMSAPRRGTVKSFRYAEGVQVEAGAELVEFEPIE
jgi:3-methylcrotonyl-CoA carboxylase alpha subunit